MERRLASYSAQLQQLDKHADIHGVEDQTDAASDLESADDRAQLQELLANVQTVLERALPLPSGSDDGVIRRGSTVRVRDERGEEQRLTLVDGVELEEGADLNEGAADVSLDSPVGRALLGQVVGDAVSILTPHGNRILKVLSVEPYRASAT